MRLFFALEPAPELTLSLAEWRDRQLPADGRPVPMANFHITLAFLGEVQPRDLEPLCEAVDAELADRPAPGGELCLDRVGFWPRPGICWLGPDQWPAELTTLAGRLAARGRRSGRGDGRGFSPARFQPHVTLYRHCQSPPPAPTAAPDLSLDYRHFALFESAQGRAGVHYRALQHWELDPA